MTPKKFRLSTGQQTVFALVALAVLLVIVPKGSSGTELILLVFLSPFLLIAGVLYLLWRAGNKQPVIVAPTTDAGWYPDQNDPRLLRWFDGANWTSATLPNR